MGSNNHFSSQQPLSLITLFQTRLSDQPNTFKMAFFKSLIIASVAAVALAQGASDKNTKVDVDSQSGAPKCGNGQKIACCNSGEDLIGLNCLSVPILAIPINRLAVPTSLLAARPVTPRATPSTSRPTALPSRFKRDNSNTSCDYLTTFQHLQSGKDGFRRLESSSIVGFDWFHG